MHWKAVWRWDNPTILTGRKQMLVCSAAWKVHASRGARWFWWLIRVWWDLFSTLGFGWEFCDLFSQPRNLEVHIALQEGCGQLGVVLLASQSPVSQLEVPTVGRKEMVVRMRKTKQKKTTPPGWWVTGVSKLLVVKYIVSIILTQLVVYRNWCFRGESSNFTSWRCWCCWCCWRCWCCWCCCWCWCGVVVSVVVAVAAEYLQEQPDSISSTHPQLCQSLTKRTLIQVRNTHARYLLKAWFRSWQKKGGGFPSTKPIRWFLDGVTKMFNNLPSNSQTPAPFVSKHGIMGRLKDSGRLTVKLYREGRHELWKPWSVRCRSSRLFDFMGFLLLWPYQLYSWHTCVCICLQCSLVTGRWVARRFFNSAFGFRSLWCSSFAWWQQCQHIQERCQRVWSVMIRRTIIDWSAWRRRRMVKLGCANFVRCLSRTGAIIAVFASYAFWKWTTIVSTFAPA